MIGFSTGALKHIDLPLMEKVKLAAQTGADAVEVGFRRPEDEFSALAAEDLTAIKQIVSGCEFVSVHAPAGDVRYGDNKEAVEILDRLTWIAGELNVALVVFHANSFRDFSVLQNLGFSYGIENIDGRKRPGTLPGDMEPILKKYPHFNLVLDVNHMAIVDPSFASLDRVLEEFGERIKEIHLSGYNLAVDRHLPLFKTKQAEIIEAYRKIKRFNPLVIIESHVDPNNAAEELAKEFEFVRSL